MQLRFQKTFGAQNLFLDIFLYRNILTEWRERQPRRTYSTDRGTPAAPGDRGAGRRQGVRGGGSGGANADVAAGCFQAPGGVTQGWSGVGDQARTTPDVPFECGQECMSG